MATKDLGITGVLYQDRRTFYPSPQQYARLYPGVTPFLSGIFTKGGRAVPDPDYKMFEYRASWRYQSFQLNDATPPAWPTSGAPGETVQITVDNPEGITVDASLIGKVLEIRDSADSYKGHARVNAVSNSTTVTIKALGARGSGSEEIAALADDDKFYVVGTAYGEKAEAPDASSDELETVWNSTQQFRTTVEITKTLQKAALRGDRDELRRLREVKLNEHKIQMERAMLFGYRTGGIGGTAHNAGGVNDNTFIDHQTDADSDTVRTTMGLVSAIYRYGRTSGDQQNIFTISESSYKYADFVTQMEKIFQYNPVGGERIAYVGPSALNYWSKLDGSTGLAGQSSWSVQISDSQRSKLGYNYRKLETPSGVLNLVPAPVLRGPYSGLMIVPDMDNIELKQFEKPEYNTNIKTDNAPRIVKDEYFNNEGLGLTLLESHAVFEVTA